MKKILMLSISLLLLVCGCGKFNITQAKDQFKNKVTSAKGYELKGIMEIYNNEDTFKYDLVVNYQKDDNYKVSMINQNNNHEQIILKNDSGVYVVTPSLNKSFKFESEWPDNSSQSYILSSLVNDVMNDQNAKLKEDKDGYIITVKVNYPHNKSLQTQNLYFDKKMNLKKVIVYDKDSNEKIKIVIDNIDYKAKYKHDYFELNSLIDTNEQENNLSIKNNNKTKENDTENVDTSEEESQKESEQQEEQTTSKLNDIIYPLYIPANTYLNSKDKIVDEQVDRTILTFKGDKSFILVEEAANVSKEFEVIPVNGDPLLLTDSVAALSDNSLSWISNNVEYYLTSNTLTTDEMMSVAQSMGTVALEK